MPTIINGSVTKSAVVLKNIFVFVSNVDVNSRGLDFQQPKEFHPQSKKQSYIPYQPTILDRIKGIYIKEQSFKMSTKHCCNYSKARKNMGKLERYTQGIH